MSASSSKSIIIESGNSKSLMLHDIGCVPSITINDSSLFKDKLYLLLSDKSKVIPFVPNSNHKVKTFSSIGSYEISETSKIPLSQWLIVSDETSSSEWLEETHNYIQWLFPTDEPSRSSFGAPILPNEDSEELRGYLLNPNVIFNIMSSWILMMGFFGFGVGEGMGAVYYKNCKNFLMFEDGDLRNQSSGSRIRIGSEFNINCKAYENLIYNGHNELRMTRIVKCLTQFKLFKLADITLDAFNKLLKSVMRTRRRIFERKKQQQQNPKLSYAAAAAQGAYSSSSSSKKNIGEDVVNNNVVGGVVYANEFLAEQRKILDANVVEYATKFLSSTSSSLPTSDHLKGDFESLCISLFIGMNSGSNLYLIKSRADSLWE